MKKLLILTNLATITILVAIAVRHILFERQQKNNQQHKQFPHKTVTAKTAKRDCSYRLGYFDFHYKRESNNPKVIMLGNSLIRRENWDSLLGRKDVINRGIAGDLLPCICERLKYLRNSPAKICFIEGGINDLPGGNTDSLFKYYTEIVNFWKDQKKIPVINLILYISPKAAMTFPGRKEFDSINDTISKLNTMLTRFSIDENLDFINLNTSVSDTARKLLLNKFTIDGVHLTNEAYKFWGQQIQLILKKHHI